MQPYWPSLSELCVELILWSASNLQANCKHYTFPNELSIFLLLYGQITSFLEIKSPFTPMAECVDYNLSAAGECFLSFFFLVVKFWMVLWSVLGPKQKHCLLLYFLTISTKGVFQVSGSFISVSVPTWFLPSLCMDSFLLLLLCFLLL